DYSVNSATLVRFRDIRVDGNVNGTWTLFYLNNNFRNSWRGVIVDGTHTAGTQRPNQTGWEFRNNAGDNRIVDSDIGSLGNAILTSSIMNYVTATIFSTCNYGIRCDS